MTNRWERQLQDLAAQPRASDTEIAECRKGRLVFAESGACRFFDRTQLTITHADPALLIDVQLLGAITAGLTSPFITYDHDDRLLKIDAANGLFVYRIGRPVRAEDGRVPALCMRWPD